MNIRLHERIALRTELNIIGGIQSHQDSASRYEAISQRTKNGLRRVVIEVVEHETGHDEVKCCRSKGDAVTDIALDDRTTSVSPGDLESAEREIETHNTQTVVHRTQRVSTRPASGIQHLSALHGGKCIRPALEPIILIGRRFSRNLIPLLPNMSNIRLRRTGCPVLEITQRSVRSLGWARLFESLFAQLA
tara:strand:- start:62 stop:634 length:573 start_codon:yes stop_codon:yes gene_type:complete